MTKQALCVKLSDITSTTIEQWDTFMRDRAICDSKENFNPEEIQLIVYGIFMVLSPDGDPLKAKYAVYERPTDGDESRLHGKLSIGFGGHVDSPVETDLFTLLVQTYIREIQEELGYAIPYKTASAAMMNAFRHGRLIYAPEDEVDAVHIGIVPVIAITENEFNEFKPKTDEIIDLRLMSVKELSLWPETDSEIDGGCDLSQLLNSELLGKFENWSKHILEGDVKSIHRGLAEAGLRARMQQLAEEAAAEEQAAAARRAAEEQSADEDKSEESETKSDEPPMHVPV